MPEMIDPELKTFATETQARYVDAINENQGNIRAAARALGVDHATLVRRIQTLKQRAAMRGYAPEADMRTPVPDPFIVRGHSTLYDESGKVRLQWVKTKLDDQLREQAVRMAVEALAEDVPRAKPVAPPQHAAVHLCNLFTLTDCHVGMRAWKPETGGDWDLRIAERVLIGAFQHMVFSAPRAGLAIVNQLGDFLHFDSLTPVTPTHGHVLDGDGRYGKVVRVATKILRAVIDCALQTHERVIVLMAEGNHDLASSVWLRHLFALLYENEPRVQVIDSELPYYTVRHGKTMLAFHHGHLTKNENLPLLFAAQFPEMWGATTKRYCHVGHRHHVDEKEFGGMRVLQHPTLAARDAHASRGGWISEREVAAITYHAEFGQVARNIVTPEMLEAA